MPHINYETASVPAGCRESIRRMAKGNVLRCPFRGSSLMNNL